MANIPNPTPDDPPARKSSPDGWVAHIIEQLPGIVWTLDGDLRFTSSYGRGLVGLGLKQNQVVGLTLAEFFREDPSGPSSIAAHRLALAGEAVTIEQSVMSRVYQTEVEPLRHGDRIIGTIGVAIDITERKAEETRLRESHDELEARVEARTAELNQAIADLRQSEKRYAGILNTQRTFIGRADKSRRMTYMNDAYREAFAQNLGDDYLNIIHTDHWPAVLDRGGKIGVAPIIPVWEHRCLIKGEWRWVLWQTSIIFDEQGNIVEIQAVGFDVHERHTAEEALRQSELHFRESAEVNRRLLMELDHRVRNNLAGLISLAGLMRETAQSVPAYADAILSRLRGIAHVHHVLTERHWTNVDLRDLVTSLMNATRDLCPRTIPISIDGPPVSIHAEDALPLANILVEWLTNSCKYGAHQSQTGTVNITWSTVGVDSAAILHVAWREIGGPLVRRPEKISLGTQLVDGFATRELRGKVYLDFPESGACHRLEFPHNRRPSG